MGVGIKIKKIHDIPIVEIHGKVSSDDAIKISKKLESFIDKSNPNVVVDLSNIGYIDSHWLGVFVYTWKLFKEHNQELIFLIPPGFILELFHNSNLDRTFKVIDSIEALATLTSPAAVPAPAQPNEQ